VVARDLGEAVDRRPDEDAEQRVETARQRVDAYLPVDRRRPRVPDRRAARRAGDVRVFTGLERRVDVRVRARDALAGEDERVREVVVRRRGGGRQHRRGARRAAGAQAEARGGREQDDPKPHELTTSAHADVSLHRIPLGSDPTQKYWRSSDAAIGRAAYDTVLRGLAPSRRTTRSASTASKPIASRVSRVALAMCGVNTTFSSASRSSRTSGSCS